MPWFSLSYVVPRAAGAVGPRPPEMGLRAPGGAQDSPPLVSSWKEQPDPGVLPKKSGPWGYKPQRPLKIS